MTEKSKFLRWQDKNGDMLPDSCPEDALPRVNKCLPCSPNPSATVPKWKNLTQAEPYLNERLCKYQISFLTMEPRTTVGAGSPASAHQAKLDGIWEHYILDWTNNYDGTLGRTWLDRQPIDPGEPRPGAIRSLLEWGGKDTSPESIEKIKDALEKTEYYLEPNPGSSVQLLYSVPFEVYEAIPDPPEPVVEEPEPGDVTVKYEVGELVMNTIKVRKGMFMYARYLKVYRAMEGANLVHKDGRIFNLEDYGDYLPWDNNSYIAQCLSELDDWLNGADLNIPNTGFPHWFTESVEKIEIKTTGEYKLKSIKVWTDRCNERPIYFGKARCRSLMQRRAWKNPTAVAFFMKLNEISRELSARVERPWLEVLKEYTYPEIHTTGPGAGQIMPEGDESIPRCIANALANEAKTLGQDIMDDVFSIGDAIAYAFHKNLCRYDPTEVNADNAEIGTNFGVKESTVKDILDDKTSMWGSAMMQAYKEVDAQDQIFANFCMRMMMIRGGSPLQMMDDIWANGFERIKICGLFDLLISALECLTKGLSLEEALGILLKNALSSMSIEDFGVLFVGLPPDEQDKLGKMVKDKIESGKAFKGMTEKYTDAQGQAGTQSKVATADKENKFFGKIKFTKPWENPSIIAAQKKALKEDGLGNMTPGGGPGRGRAPTTSASNTTTVRRSLAEKLDLGKVAKDEMDPSLVMDAYIMALLDYYSDNYLSLLDKLNDFPGAQIISMLLSTLDCPKPPLFNPGIADFLKSLTLPFCRNLNEITMPRMENPFLWWPKLQDILGILFELMKLLLMQLIIRIIIRVIVWLCQLIGDAICKALEVTGAVIGSLPAVVSGHKTFMNVLRDAICGDDTTDDEMSHVVVQLVADLGVGGQALADPDRALTFMEDISAAASQTELVSAMLGDPSVTFLRISDQIRENGYPEYGDALPNEQSLGRFFTNIGNLIPAEMRLEMRQALDALGPDDETPANPTLCATPESLQSFKDLRCQLLEGRATPEQCDEMFDNWRGTMMDDLDEVSKIMNQGIGQYVADQIPPIVGDPGCNNGLLPYEPDQFIETAAKALDGDMKKIQISFSTDMLGNGGLFAGGDAGWGFINMILSDTIGNPYTVHQRKSFNKDDYVDFYMDADKGWMDDVDEGDLQGVSFSSLSDQEGAFPQYVGEWLMYQYEAASGVESQELKDMEVRSVRNDLKSNLIFDSTNNPQKLKKWPISFSDLGFCGLFICDVDLTEIPDMGYNVKTAPQWDKERMWFIRKPRKKSSDIKLVFKDNAKGYRFGLNGGQSEFSYGFDLNAYFSDMIENPDGAGYINRPDDNIRIKITDLYNMAAKSKKDGYEKLQEANAGSAAGSVEDDEEKILRSRKYEFLGVDDGLDSLYDNGSDGLTMVDFPNLNQCFTRQDPFPPQVNMLYDLLDGAESKSVIKTAYDSFMKEQFKQVIKEMATNKKAWKYGAEFDDVDMADFDYLAPPKFKDYADNPDGRGRSVGKPKQSDGVLYSELEVADFDSDGERDGSRAISNDDATLGYSRNQWINEARGTHPEKTRVFYLDPGKYGGTYMNPPVYVKPKKSEGWMGVVDVMFPEISPCSPKLTDVVDFADIAQKISMSYPTIPEDSRLKGDPDCVVETPYNRILARYSKASIEGIISASIRIFASVHFLKGLPLFTKFAPVFPTNYSNVYSAYVIENMEDNFRNAGADFLSPFKDNEFWYGFLEQSVQTYARRVDNDEFGIDGENVPKDVKDALDRLNNLQSGFDYPYSEELWEAKWAGETGFFNSLKNFREEKNFDAVYRTQEDAKLILKELVNEQLTITADRFVRNLTTLGMKPDITDLDYYYMTNFCHGTAEKGLTLEGTLVENVVGMPSSKVDDEGEYQFKESPLPGIEYNELSIVETNDDGTPAMVAWPGPFYTNGGEFSVPDGSDYVGYYHGIVNEETGMDEYFVGEFIQDMETQLRIFADKLILGFESVIDHGIPEPTEGGQGAGLGKANYEFTFTPLGDIPDYNEIHTTTEKMFYMVKYISINGEKLSMADGIERIKAAGPGPLSSHFPGTLRLNKDGDGNVKTGKPLRGNLGVRYGIEFGMKGAGWRTAHALTNIEIDALDVPTSAFAGIEKDSKLLWCLIQKLKEDQRFKLVTNYAFSLKKVLSIMAIYQDMGMLPSVGEVTVESGATYGDIFHDADDYEPYSTTGEVKKPGTYADLKMKIIEVEGSNWLGFDDTWEVPSVESAKLSHTPGWVSENDRNGFWPTWFVEKWDEWDQLTLRKSSKTIKRMFQVHYRSRDFGGGEDAMDNLALSYMQQLKERFRISPGKAFLPHWKRSRIRSNPFNDNGELCKKKD
tara:strand:- start:13234 stop:20202 length:6969 start_codon:yes stop_codon:yes gene_type:complete